MTVLWWRCCIAANAKRQKRLAEELALHAPAAGSAVGRVSGVRAGVSPQSLIRVRKHTYSVPARLIGHKVRVEVYEGQLKVFGAGVAVSVCRARAGTGERWLTFVTLSSRCCASPGPSSHYRHREALYPSVTFRRPLTGW